MGNHPSGTIYICYTISKLWIWDNPWVAQHLLWIHALHRQSMECLRPKTINQTLTLNLEDYNVGSLTLNMNP